MLGALVGLTAWAAMPEPTAALTCATAPNGAELAIRSGWPEAAPLDHVLIATILEIQPVNGDAGTWGEVLTVNIDAMLRGDLPPSTVEIFNPPLGSPGWPWFTPGGQFLIAAHANGGEASGGRISTNLCAPNEEITSADRFQELVALSAEPRLADTAMRPVSPLPFAGVGLVLLGLTLATVRRRSMRSNDRVH
jgi:hypothetical protein